MNILKIFTISFLLFALPDSASAAVVWVTVTIDGQNNPVITPSPVSVADGDWLAVKLDAINYECPPDGHLPKVKVHFPPNGPVVDGYHEIRIGTPTQNSRHIVSPVEWPKGMTSYTYYVISACSPGDPIPFTIIKAEKSSDCSCCGFDSIVLAHWILITILMFILVVLIIISVQLQRNRN